MYMWQAGQAQVFGVGADAEGGGALLGRSFKWDITESFQQGF